MKLIYREDDINKNTSLEAIKFTHQQFVRAHKDHTIAIICEGLENNTEVIDYINKTKNWNFAIHGWTHDNYCLMSRSRIEDELDRCILLIEKLFGEVPEKWYLPWNGWTKNQGFDKIAYVADIAIYHGVDVDTDCDHISHFLKHLEAGKNPVTDTVYFHGWDVEDLKLLPTLLFLTEKNGR
jgi:peptidoglycan/xylan/chitin deacetylase (PgdA/CDA1 family)